MKFTSFSSYAYASANMASASQSEKRAEKSRSLLNNLTLRLDGTPPRQNAGAGVSSPAPLPGLGSPDGLRRTSTANLRSTSAKHRPASSLDAAASSIVTGQEAELGVSVVVFQGGRLEIFPVAERADTGDAVGMLSAKHLTVVAQDTALDPALVAHIDANRGERSGELFAVPDDIVCALAELCGTSPESLYKVPREELRAAAASAGTTSLGQSATAGEALETTWLLTLGKLFERDEIESGDGWIKPPLSFTDPFLISLSAAFASRLRKRQELVNEFRAGGGADDSEEETSLSSSAGTPKAAPAPPATAADAPFVSSKEALELQILELQRDEALALANDRLVAKEKIREKDRLELRVLNLKIAKGEQEADKTSRRLESAKNAPKERARLAEWGDADPVRPGPPTVLIVITSHLLDPSAAQFATAIADFIISFTLELSNEIFPWIIDSGFVVPPALAKALASGLKNWETVASSIDLRDFREQGEDAGHVAAFKVHLAAGTAPGNDEGRGGGMSWRSLRFRLGVTAAVMAALTGPGAEIVRELTARLHLCSALDVKFPGIVEKLAGSKDFMEALTEDTEYTCKSFTKVFAAMLRGSAAGEVDDLHEGCVLEAGVNNRGVGTAADIFQVLGEFFRAQKASRILGSAAWKHWMGTVAVRAGASTAPAELPTFTRNSWTPCVPPSFNFSGKSDLMRQATELWKSKDPEAVEGAGPCWRLHTKGLCARQPGNRRCSFSHGDARAPSDVLRLLAGSDYVAPK